MFMALFTGVPLHTFETLPSTNDFAMDMLKSQPVEGTTILTYFQSAGKGQRGNTWEVAPGLNLTASIIYRPTFLLIEEVFMLSKVAALAVADTLAAFAPQADISIKWPNDILLNQQKIAGILIENQLEGKHLAYSVLGLGINLNQQQFPASLRTPATSLRAFLQQTVPIDQVLTEICEQLEHWYLLLKQGRTEHIDRTYLQRLYGYQSEVTVLIDGQLTPAHLVGVDNHGRLALAMDDKLAYFAVKEAQIQVST